MPTVITQYDAKCKHCKHFTRKRKIKKDGTPSKLHDISCANVESIFYNLHITSKSYCTKFEL